MLSSDKLLKNVFIKVRSQLMKKRKTSRSYTDWRKNFFIDIISINSSLKKKFPINVVQCKLKFLQLEEMDGFIHSWFASKTKSHKKYCSLDTILSLLLLLLPNVFVTLSLYINNTQAINPSAFTNCQWNS